MSHLHIAAISSPVVLDGPVGSMDVVSRVSALGDPMSTPVVLDGPGGSMDVVSRVSVLGDPTSTPVVLDGPGGSMDVVSGVSVLGDPVGVGELVPGVQRVEVRKYTVNKISTIIYMTSN